MSRLPTMWFILSASVAAALLVACATNGEDSATVDLSEFSTVSQEGEFAEGSGGHSTLVDHRVGQHEGFERLVLEFNGEPPAQHSVGYTDAAIRGMPDVGDTTDHLAGYEVLELTVNGLEPEGAHQAPELHSMGSWQPEQSEIIAEVVMGLLFEGTATYFIGLENESEFHLSHAEDPYRVIIDIAVD